MSIRTKIALSYLTTVILLTALLTFVVISKTLEKSIEEFVFHAQQKMKLVNNSYQDFFEMVGQDVKYLASNEIYAQLTTELSTYMDETPRPTDATAVGGIEAEIERYYEKYGASRPYLRDIYLGTVNGGFVGLIDEDLASYDPRLRPWYKVAIGNSEHATVSDPYRSTSKAPMISVAMPVTRSDGSLLGVQSVDVTLNQLTGLVQSVRLGESGYMMLIDENGTILSDPSDANNLFMNVADIDDPFYRALASRPTESFEVEQNGRKKQIATYFADRSNWQFVAIIDSAEIIGRQWPMIQTVLVLAAIMAAIFLAFGFYVAAKVTSPIVHITRSLQKIAEGEADFTEELEVGDDDEIGALAMWFNKFLCSAREKQGEHLRAQKLEAIGQLSAGIAHEINTPTQYVSDNLSFLHDSFDDLKPVLTSYRDLIDLASQYGADQTCLEPFRKISDEADTDYVLAEIPSALQQSREGIDHVKKIVGAMKNFSHPGDEMKPVDLNKAIESTVTVARNEWKFVADMALDLQSDLPAITCIPSAFNQVILNLIVNAAHAIDDANNGSNGSKGTISVTTHSENDVATITVSDTGCGIPQELRQKIFDPFFTTKEVGKGTGQGLSMAYDIIVKKHGGDLGVDSEMGVGTKFTICLPIENDHAIQASVASIH